MPSNAEHEGPSAPTERLTVDGRVELIRSGLETWREGFLAYLLLPDVDLSDPELVHHYTNCYAGWYPDRRSFVEGQIDALDWQPALAEFRERNGIPKGLLELDWDELWGHCCEIYSVVERLGGVHVFTR